MPRKFIRLRTPRKYLKKDKDYSNLSAIMKSRESKTAFNIRPPEMEEDPYSEAFILKSNVGYLETPQVSGDTVGDSDLEYREQATIPVTGTIGSEYYETQVMQPDLNSQYHASPNIDNINLSEFDQRIENINIQLNENAVQLRNPDVYINESINYNTQIIPENLNISPAKVTTQINEYTDTVVRPY